MLCFCLIVHLAADVALASPSSVAARVEVLLQEDRPLAAIDEARGFVRQGFSAQELVPLDDALLRAAAKQRIEQTDE